MSGGLPGEFQVTGPWPLESSRSLVTVKHSKGGVWQDKGHLEEGTTSYCTTWPDSRLKLGMQSCVAKWHVLPVLISSQTGSILTPSFWVTPMVGTRGTVHPLLRGCLEEDRSSSLGSHF